MNESAKTYTAFWPVFIVFLCFTITNVLNLIGNLETRGNLNKAMAQLQQGAGQAKAKEEALTGIAHDLLNLAPTSAVAQQIVTDFHIQLRNQAQAPARPAANPAPAAPAAAKP